MESALFVVAIFLAASLCFLLTALFIREKEVPEQIREDSNTGCFSSLACQNMDLQKAKQSGYDSRKCTYCRAYEAFVKRSDHCPCFYPHGCGNGVCAHANYQCNGYCFCKLQGQTVAEKETCPNYTDFFETRLGKKLLEANS